MGILLRKITNSMEISIKLNENAIFTSILLLNHLNPTQIILKEFLVQKIEFAL